MQVNMPVTVELNYNANTTVAKKDSGADLNTQGFEQVLKASQSSKEISNAENTENTDILSTEELDSSFREELKDLLESDTTTIEELILALISIYSHNSEPKMAVNNVDYATRSYEEAGNDVIQNLSSLELGTADNKNSVLQLVSNLLSTDELPEEAKDILQQYVKVSEETPEFTLQDFSMNLNIPTEKIGQANRSEVETLKNSIVEQINNFLKASNNGGQVQSETVEPVVLSMEEVIPVDYRMDKTEDMKTTEDMKDKKNFEGSEFKTNSFFSDMNRLNRVNNSKNVKSPVLLSEEKATADNSSIVKKEEAFLKGILEDNPKGEGKINLFMNYFRVDKNVQEPMQVQSEVVVNRVTFVNDIIKAVKFMETSNLKELKVSINPKEIGELLITVTMESGKMKANIEANSKESYNLLMSNLDEIKKAIGNNEISLQDINVSINQGDTTFFKDSSQRQDRQNENSSNTIRTTKLALEEDVDISEVNDNLNDSQINMLA